MIYFNDFMAVFRKFPRNSWVPLGVLLSISQGAPPEISTEVPSGITQADFTRFLPELLLSILPGFCWGNLGVFQYFFFPEFLPKFLPESFPETCDILAVVPCRISSGIPPEIYPRVFLIGEKFLLEVLLGFLPEFLPVFLPGLVPGFLQKFYARIRPQFLSGFLEQMFQDSFPSSFWDFSWSSAGITLRGFLSICLRRSSRDSYWRSSQDFS